MKNFWNFRRENFKSRSSIYIIPFLLLPLFFISQSCKKEISSIGLGFQDELLSAVFTDTVTLKTYSVLEDTLNTTGLVFNFLGYVNDNIFGTTTANIFAQLVPKGNNINFGEFPKLDSIVLTLRYTGGFYGDTLNPFTIKVYELKEDILTDKIYYQNNSIAYYESKNLTNSDFHLSPKPNTKVKIDTLLGAHARIRLSDELGNRFLENAKDLANAEVFKKFFKGLYIKAEPFQNNGSLVNFSLSNALSGIQLYYHNKDSAKAKQFSFTFSDKDLSPVRFSNYQHNYEVGAPNLVAQIDTLKTENEKEMIGKEALYVQSMGGIKTKIAFPYIKTFKNRKVVINKAELVITNIGDNLHLYPNPNRLGIQAVNSSGKLVIIPDNASGATYFGGSYDEKTKEYRFRITRYLQNLIQKEEYQPYIYLVAEGAAAYANRLVLSGTNPAEVSKRLRLEIYYTEY